MARTEITALARLGVVPLDVANVSREISGSALDTQSDQKMTRLLHLCDVMNLPILQLVHARKSRHALVCLEHLADGR